MSKIQGFLACLLTVKSNLCAVKIQSCLSQCSYQKNEKVWDRVLFLFGDGYIQELGTPKAQEYLGLWVLSAGTNYCAEKIVQQSCVVTVQPCLLHIITKLEKARMYIKFVLFRAVLCTWPTEKPMGSYLVCVNNLIVTEVKMSHTQGYLGPWFLSTRTHNFLLQVVTLGSFFTVFGCVCHSLSSPPQQSMGLCWVYTNNCVVREVRIPKGQGHLELWWVVARNCTVPLKVVPLVPSITV